MLPPVDKRRQRETCGCTSVLDSASAGSSYHWRRVPEDTGWAAGVRHGRGGRGLYRRRFGLVLQPVAGVYGSEGLGKFGLAFDYWGSGAIQGINIRGETIPGYTVSAADWSLNLGYARSISDFSVGLGLKLIHQQQESLSTSAVAFDVGAMYKTPLKGLQAGVSVANIGTSSCPRPRSRA
jgi:hypothetical protein